MSAADHNPEHNNYHPFKVPQSRI